MVEEKKYANEVIEKCESVDNLLTTAKNLVTRYEELKKFVESQKDKMENELETLRLRLGDKFTSEVEKQFRESYPYSE